MSKFKKGMIKLAFFFANLIFNLCYGQNSEIGVRGYYNYSLSVKGVGNQFSSKIKYPRNQYSYEISYAKPFYFKKDKYPYLEIKLGGGFNLITNNLYFQTRTSNDKNAILLPFLLNTYTITPVTVFKTKIKLRTEVLIPIRLHHQNKYYDFQYFPYINLGYSLIFNSKKVIPRTNFGFNSNITPCLVGKNDVGETVTKYFRNSIFLSFNLK